MTRGPFPSTGHKASAPLEVVHMDRGKEYVNRNLGAWLRQKGIEHGLSVAYTPEQNGAAERLNRTLLERARAMLQDAGLPHGLWGEALATAAYLRNLSPNANDVTPYTALYGHVPDISHLRVFGSTAYAHVPKVKRNKLDPVSTKGTLVGYQANHYRILMDNGTVEVCSSVIFDETASASEPVGAPHLFLQTHQQQ